MRRCGKIKPRGDTDVHTCPHKDSSTQETYLLNQISQLTSSVIACGVSTVHYHLAAVIKKKKKLKTYFLWNTKLKELTDCYSSEWHTWRGCEGCTFVIYCTYQCIEIRQLHLVYPESWFWICQHFSPLVWLPAWPWSTLLSAVFHSSGDPSRSTGQSPPGGAHLLGQTPPPSKLPHSAYW